MQQTIFLKAVNNVVCLFVLGLLEENRAQTILVGGLLVAVAVVIDNINNYRENNTYIYIYIFIINNESNKIKLWQTKQTNEKYEGILNVSLTIIFKINKYSYYFGETPNQQPTTTTTRTSMCLHFFFVLKSKKKKKEN